MPSTSNSPPGAPRPTVVATSFPRSRCRFARAPGSPCLSPRARATTFYSDSLFRDTDDTFTESESDFRGETLSRLVPTASAEIVGPSFSRIFDLKSKKWEKLKHVIEPRFTYGYIDEFDEQDRVPVFDEIDNVRGLNVGRVSLINRFLAKPRGDGGSREILSVTFYQDYSLDDERAAAALV